MRRLFVTVIVAFVSILTVPVSRAAAPLSADEIVSRADEIRSPRTDYTVGVAITSKRPGSGDRKAEYEVLVKGRDRTVIKTLSPPADRGRTLLMLGRDLWAFLPDISKPIRISLQQRLIGEVANGDIARADFSGDYAPKLVRTDDIEKKKYFVLELIANSDEVTYGRVLYWVRVADFRPFKAEFYASSGRLLKTCSYTDYRTLANRERPSKLVIEDPLTKGASIIEYYGMNTVDLPEKLFTKDHMKKLKY